jgi:hypothetical protein
MALGWVKRRGAQHNGSQGIVKSIEQRRRQLQRFGSGLLQHVRHVAPLSYGPAPKQLGEQESSAVDIHQGRDRFAAHRFGGHVAGLPAASGWLASLGDRATRTAIPKSMTLARPRASSNTLDGLRSRWTTPSAWAAAKALRTS